VGKLERKKEKRLNGVSYYPQRQRCLIDLIINKGLDKANHLSKKVGPRQDLNWASVMITNI